MKYCALIATLLVAFGGPAGAAARHHHRVRHHAASRVTKRAAPDYDDASKFGGSTALPAE